MFIQYLKKYHVPFFNCICCLLLHSWIHKCFTLYTVYKVDSFVFLSHGSWSLPHVSRELIGCHGNGYMLWLHNCMLWIKGASSSSRWGILHKALTQLKEAFGTYSVIIQYTCFYKSHCAIKTGCICQSQVTICNALFTIFRSQLQYIQTG